MNRCAPPIETFDNEFHEVWWDSSGFVADNGRPQVPLHEVWLWMGDGDQTWRRCGEVEPLTAEDAYKEGWRYVRPVKLLDEEMRMAGQPPENPS